MMATCERRFTERSLGTTGTSGHSVSGVSLPAQPLVPMETLMTSPTWPGGPTAPTSPNVPAPPGATGPYGPAPGATPFASMSAQRALRKTYWLDAVLFAVASSTVAGALWWAVVAFTKTQFVYGAIAVGALVGLATALGARKSGIGTALLAGGCTLVALVVAEYFIQRTLAINSGIAGIPLWDGFGFARDVVKSAVEEDGLIPLFWGLAVLAAAFTNFRN